MRRSITSRRNGGRARRAIGSFVSAAMVAAVGVVATPAEVRAASPEEEALADGLRQALEAFDGLDDLGPLADPLPLTDVFPTGADGLALLDTIDRLVNAVPAVPGFPDDQVEQALDGLDGSSIDGIVLAVDADVDGGSISFTTLTATRQVLVPLRFVDEDNDIDLSGGSISGTLTLDLAGLSGSLDSSDLLVLDAGTLGSVSASLDVDLTGETLRLGIVDVTVTAGTASADVDVELALLDPDGVGGVTLDELAASSPTDLFDLVPTQSTASVDVALQVAAGSLLAGVPDLDGSFSFTDDLLDGDDPVVDVQLPELGNFGKMGPAEILVALAQVAVSLQAMQVRVANPDLPVLGAEVPTLGQPTPSDTLENLADLFDVNAKLAEFFVSKGLSTADNPFEIKVGDVDGDGVVDIDLQTLDLDTIDGIITELAAHLGDVVDLDYDPAADAILFDLGFNAEYDAPPAVIKLNDQLAELGLAGVVSANGTAGVGITSDYDIDLGVGIAIGEFDIDDPITDVIFIQTDGAGPEIRANATVDADLTLGGTIGFLEVMLADQSTDGDDANLTTADYVTVLRKPAGAENMVEIDLAGGTDGRLTLTDIFGALGSLDVATPAANQFQLSGGPDGFTLTGTIDAEVPLTTLAVSATIGDEQLAGATVEFAWPSILDGAPTVDASATFDDDFFSFNIDPENPLALFNQIVAAVDAGLAAVEGIDAGGVLDEELPVLGASLRDSVGFLDDVQDAVNELAQDPAGSLQAFELALQLAVAEALGFDPTTDPDLVAAGITDLTDLLSPPNPNDASSIADGGFIDDNGTPGDPSDDVFDDALFQAAVTAYYDAVDTFLDEVDFVELDYVPGNSPGAITVTLNLGVCSSVATYGPGGTTPSGCTVEQPLSSSFNFDTGSLGLPSGLVAAGASGEVELDYNASADITIGVELPDVAGGEVTPKPFVADSSSIDLSLAGALTTAFSANLGPFEVNVGVDGPPEDCSTAADDDGDGTANDGCPEVPNPETACDDGVDDDGDGTADDGCPEEGAPDATGPGPETGAECENGTDDDGDGAVNDGCDEIVTAVQAKAGARFTVAGDVTNDRAYLFPEAGDEGLGALFDSIDLSTALTESPTVDCGGTTPLFACASLPILVGVGSDPVYLGTIGLEVDSLSPFNVDTTGDSITDIRDALVAELDTLAWQLIGQGLAELGDYIEEATEGAAYDIEIPVIGEALDAGAEIGATFNQEFAQPVATFLQTGPGTSIDEARTYFADLVVTTLGTDPDSLLVDRDGNGTKGAEDVTVTLLCGGATECEQGTHDVFQITDVAVEFGLGDEVVSTGVDFDFGIPGLRLASEDQLTTDVSWEIDVGFGLSLDDGFYLITDGEDEISFDVSVDVPDLSADIAFLGVEIDTDVLAKPGSRPAEEVSLGVAIDLPDPLGTGKLPLTRLASINPRDLLPEFTGGVDLYWQITTAPDFGGTGAIDDSSLPTVVATLDLTWNVSLGADGLDYSGLNVAFDDVQLDLGSFVSDFLAPMLDGVQQYTEPLQPVIDIVTAPIPGISQLAELTGADPVTLLTLFEEISGNDLTLIKTLLDVITFANSIQADTGDGIMIQIGSFTVSGSQLGAAELPANRKGELIATSTVTTASIAAAVDGIGGDFAAAFDDNVVAPDAFTDDTPGFTFPAFQDLSQVFNLLLGEDVTLVRFASGKLKAELGFSESFGPIAVGPVPVSVVISGSAGIEGRFALGYDTKGIRQLVKSLTADDGPDVSFLQGFGFLFNGLFIDDLNAAGQDVPEIRLFVEFAAGAAVDLLVVSAGVEGGVRATLDLNLHDGGFSNPVPPENLDGKLRLDEIASFIFNNPICLFDVSGKVTAFIRLFVEIDLLLVSKKFSFTVVNITLLDLQNITAELCEPPEPELAEQVGSTLVLNVGPREGDRNFAEGSPESYIVRQTGGGTTGDLVVSAFGYEETYRGVDRVVGDFGEKDDSIKFLAGSTESVDGDGNISSTPIPFLIATEICGGAGDDLLEGGDGVDRLVGDGEWNGNADSGFACETSGGAPAGNDQIAGGAGDDRIDGTGEADTLSGGPGADTIDGGSGNDQVNGDIGGDTIHGGDGDDTLNGGADVDPDGDSDPDEAGVQPYPAGISDDTIHGDAGFDTIDGDRGDDTLNGGDDDDVIIGGFGDDTAHGDDGDDLVLGNQGDDRLLDGDAGDDRVFGDVGDDVIEGGPGEDNLIGGDGIDHVVGEAGLDVILGDVGEINRALPADSLAPTDPDRPLVTRLSSAGAAGDVLDGGADPDVIHGQAGDDTIDGGAADDQLFGQAGVDTMSGDEGADTMFGDGDGDVMYGDDSSGSHGCADGGDLMRGGTGNDFLEGNADADRIFGDSGDDEIYGDAETPGGCDLGDTIRGNGDPDRIWGNADADGINGDGGEDRLVGGGRHFGEDDGGDTIHGDAADDVIAGDNADIADGGGTPATFAVTTFLDEEGTGDLLFGDDGTDRIFGQAGTDDISGGSAQDFLEGNAESDVIAGDGGDDRISGGSSSHSTIDDGSATPRPYDLAPDSGDVIAGGTGDDVIAGDNADIGADGETSMTAAAGSGISGDDLIEGGDDQDRIYGQLGSDDLYGGDDEDYLVGDLGSISAAPDPAQPVWPGGAPNYGIDLDEPFAEATAADDVADGADELYGGNDDDHMFGGIGDDVMHGEAGDDYMEGNSGIDAMFGRSPDSIAADDQDDMIGGWSTYSRTDDVRQDDGEELMQGNGDHDVMLGDNGDVERVVDGDEWADDDVIAGARKRIVTLLDRDKVILDTVSGNDRMQGNGGSDRMYGEGGSDLVQGNAADDFIEGNQDGDWLEGNDGEDDIIGGSSFLASDGGLDLAGADDDLGDPDGRDAIFGGGDGDVIAGDNARIIRDTSDAYEQALTVADFTTDHLDDVPGWWLGVESDRLVILLDRETRNVGRFDVDVVFGGSGADVAFGQDGDDWVGGGHDDDALEGNGGDDRMYGDLPPYEPGGAPTPGTEGNSEWSATGFVSVGEDRDGPVSGDGEDDIVGGSNVDHRDGDDDIQGDGEDDFVLGDNGTLRRWIVADNYQEHVGDGDRERWFRTATRLGVAGDAGEHGDDALDGNDGDDAIWGQDGDDLIRGQAGDDDLVGELGDDEILGGLGEDAMVGDRGSILNTELGAAGALFVEPEVTESYAGPPFLTGVEYFTAGRFDRRVDLMLEQPGSVGGPDPSGATAIVLAADGLSAGGADQMRGGPDHDSMHGAWGDDLMNGDDGGDWLFGGHGSDVMWGGRGDSAGTPDLGTSYDLVDRLFGGRGGDPAEDMGVITGGADVLDYKPRAGADAPYGTDDPAVWFEMTGPYSDADLPADQTGGSSTTQHHQGTDWIYGGYDRDVMQGNVTEPGPNAGDRMWDWTGAFNLYTHCAPDYGGYNDQRARSPQMEQFIELLAYDSGVGSSIADVRESSSSAFRELALVYKWDTKDNNGKAYPTTPGHFDEVAGCDEVPDVP